MMVITFLSLWVAVAAAQPAAPDDALIRDAIAVARTTTIADLVRPYILGDGVVVETPFIRVAFQAREAMDRYLPFSETDVDRSFLRPVVTVVANDKDRSFKHLVIAVPPPSTAPVMVPTPEPSAAPPPTYEEALRQQRAATRRRKSGSIDIDAVVAARVARAKESAKERAEERARAEELERLRREARAAMAILQPTSIEATTHEWQNAYSATFRTTGVRATFPLDALAAGREIRAVLADGSEVTATITPEVLAKLR